MSEAPDDEEDRERSILVILRFVPVVDVDCTLGGFRIDIGEDMAGILDVLVEGAVAWLRDVVARETISVNRNGM